MLMDACSTPCSRGIQLGTGTGLHRAQLDAVSHSSEVSSPCPRSPSAKTALPQDPPDLQGFTESLPRAHSKSTHRNRHTACPAAARGRLECLSGGIYEDSEFFSINHLQEELTYNSLKIRNGGGLERQAEIQRSNLKINK